MWLTLRKVASAYLAAWRLAAAVARRARRRGPVEQRRAERSVALAEMDGSGAIPTPSLSRAGTGSFLEVVSQLPQTVSARSLSRSGTGSFRGYEDMNEGGGL